MDIRKTVFKKETILADAPRPGEILINMAVNDGGRPHPRAGEGRASTSFSGHR
jgi:hypothetical protein